MNINNYLEYLQSESDFKSLMNMPIEKVNKMNEQDVKNYLDKCIIFWRNTRDKKNCKYAKYYIDAFQSMRMSFFDELYK